MVQVVTRCYRKMPTFSVALLFFIAVISLNAGMAWGAAECQAHFEKLGQEKTGAVLGAISRAMYDSGETITSNGYTVSVVKKGKCSIDIRMEDAGKATICSETITMCMDDLPPEEVDRIRRRYEREEKERQELLLRLEEDKASIESHNREKEQALQEYRRQLSEGVPQEYLENPELYLPAACKDYNAELNKIRSCQNNADCGQVLVGTSCGCTRNLVARKEANLTKFNDLRKTALALLSISSTMHDECSQITMGSTCDCPDADGFLCVDKVCTWNYTQPKTIPLIKD